MAVGRLINGDKTANGKDAYIGEISGGHFGDYDYYSSGYPGFMGCDVPINCVSNYGTINKISGGTWTALANVAVNAYGFTGRINTISGGNFERVGNEGFIGIISGGVFKENLYAFGESAIKNYGIIDTITGTAEIESLLVGSGHTGIDASFGGSGAHTGVGKVNTISGGSIITLDIETKDGFDSASVGTISGGTITTLNNGTNSYSGGGIIETISGGSIGTLNNKNGSVIKDISGGSITILNNSGEVTIGGKVKIGEFKNESSGSVTFKLAKAQIDGKLTNSNGSVNVDVSGSQIGIGYKLATGVISGVNAVNVTSANSRFLNVNYNDGTVTLNQNDEFNDFKKNLDSNKGGIADSLLTSNLDIESTSAIADTENTIKESYIAQPKSMLSAFKDGAMVASLGQSAAISMPTASAEIIGYDNGYTINPFQNETQLEYTLNPFGGILRGGGVKGYLAGLNLGVGYRGESYALQGSLSYAYADSTQDLSTQSTDTKGNMFGLGFLGRLYFAEFIETDINANFVLGMFDIDNAWVDSSLNSSGDFKHYQGNIGVVVGPRYTIGKMSLKPFLGVQNYFEKQDDFEAALGFKSEKYNDYVLNSVVGLEDHLQVGEQSFIFAKVGYEFKLYNTQKEIFMRKDDILLKYENEGYHNTLNVNFGTSIRVIESLKLNVEGLYRHYDSGLHYYGGGVSAQFVF